MVNPLYKDQVINEIASHIGIPELDKNIPGAQDRVLALVPQMLDSVFNVVDIRVGRAHEAIVDLGRRKRIMVDPLGKNPVGVPMDSAMDNYVIQVNILVDRSKQKEIEALDAEYEQLALF